MSSRDVLFWGRYGNYGPDYPRNRVIEIGLSALGHQVRRFVPAFSAVADYEAALRGMSTPDLVWVPCFRQRDLQAARRYATRQKVPLVFDPLISSYDKQVNERLKFSAGSRKGRRLLDWESKLFSLADLVIADTVGHLDYFSSVLKVPRERIRVVPVGAEEDLFQYRPPIEKSVNAPLEVVFSGTFIELHGVETVIEAASLYSSTVVKWRLLGEGPLRKTCESKVARLLKDRPDLDITFENWRPLEELPARLAQADILLGIFGASGKALRVIPNKVYQALALGRPVLTAKTGAYPVELTQDECHGIFWSPPGDAKGLCLALERLCEQRESIPGICQSARKSYEEFFSQKAIENALLEAMQYLELYPRNP